MTRPWILTPAGLALASPPAPMPAPAWEPDRRARLGREAAGELVAAYQRLAAAHGGTPASELADAARLTAGGGLGVRFASLWLEGVIGSVQAGDISAAALPQAIGHLEAAWRAALAPLDGGNA